MVKYFFKQQVLIWHRMESLWMPKCHGWLFGYVGFTPIKTLVFISLSGGWATGPSSSATQPVVSSEVDPPSWTKISILVQEGGSQCIHRQKCIVNTKIHLPARGPPNFKLPVFFSRDYNVPWINTGF